MLHEFLASNRAELESRCRAKVAERGTPLPALSELEYGVPLFIGQLIETLRAERAAAPGGPQAKLPTSIGTMAEKHGYELLRKGFTVEQVVHDYGDLCQALTELAHEKNALISVDEFHTFNRCLDNAIADAVTEFGRARDREAFEAGTGTMSERLCALAHELRSHLNTAIVALDAIRNGSVGVAGATGAVLASSLTRLGTIVDRSLAEVRLTDGLHPSPESISLTDFLSEVRIPAVIEARAKKLAFSMTVDAGLVVDADRQMLSSAIANLLHTAVQRTQPTGRVELSACAMADRVVIEIKAASSGLPSGPTEASRPRVESPSDAPSWDGVELGRRSVDANGGRLDVRNLPGSGCLFTIDLPRRTAAN